MHIPEITAAPIMGTTCWPFNFIHVRGDGGNISFIRQSPSSDCHYSAGKEKKENTHHDISNLTADAEPFCSHTDDTNIPNTWSFEQNTEERVDKRWWGGGVREIHSRRIHIHWCCAQFPPASSPSCGTSQIDVRGIKMRRISSRGS